VKRVDQVRQELQELQDSLGREDNLVSMGTMDLLVLKVYLENLV